MATSGEKLLAGVLLVGAVGFMTHGKVWQETRNEQGAINGIELIKNDVSADANPDSANSTVTTLDPSNKTQIKQSLIQLATQDSWCSSSYIAVKAEDIKTSNNEEQQQVQQSDAVVNVQVCLDPQNLDVRDGYVMAFFTTNPPLKTGEGHPSVYLTYEQDVLVGQCKTAKEEMRDQLEQSLTSVLGQAAMQTYQTEIHVSKDYMGHPCDDYFIEP